MKKILNKLREAVFYGPSPFEAALFREAATADNIFRERILAQLVLAASLMLLVVDYCVLIFDPANHRNLSLMAVLFRVFFSAFLLLFLLSTRERPNRAASRQMFWDAAMIGVSLAWVGIFSGALLLVRPGAEPY